MVLRDIPASTSFANLHIIGGHMHAYAPQSGDLKEFRVEAPVATVATVTRAMLVLEQLDSQL